MNNTVLWLYIIFLVAGGLMGFIKGKSQISLITSSIAAALLIITTIPNLLSPSLARGTADVIMAALLVVFAVRFAKTKKMMPSGMLMIVTVIALALRHIRFS